MNHKLGMLLGAILLAPLAFAAPIEYGKPDDLCGTTRLFVDAGMYLEGRNNIVAILQRAKLPNFDIAPSVSEADVLIQLTETGARNWAQWSIFVQGQSGSLRLIHQLADTDEGDGLQRYWPSSKVARKFVELHQAANRPGVCKPVSNRAPEPRSRPTGSEALATLLSDVSNHFKQLRLADLSSEPSRIESLADTKSSILANVDRIRQLENRSAVGRLQIFDRLYELRRNLDFFWFELQSTDGAGDQQEQARLEAAIAKNLSFTKRTVDAVGEIGMQLFDDMVKCEGK